MKRLFIALLVISIFACLTSSCKRSEYEMERDAIREAAYNNGYEAGYDEGYYDAYNDAFGHFSNIVNDEAVYYARKYSEWHPEEALCIIKAYENNELAFGNMQVSEKDYKDAVESLYRYCEYLYYDHYDKYD